MRTSALATDGSGETNGRQQWSGLKDDQKESTKENAVLGLTA